MCSVIDFQRFERIFNAITWWKKSDRCKMELKLPERDFLQFTPGIFPSIFAALSTKYAKSGTKSS